MLDGVIEHREQRRVIVENVDDPAGLQVQAELAPRQDLEEFFERSKSAGKCDECVRQIGHHGFALVHGMNDVQLGELFVSDLTSHEVLGDHADRFPAFFQNCIGDCTHETDVSAAVDKADLAARQFCSQLFGTCAVFQLAPGTGAAEDTDSLHTVILRWRSVEKSADATADSSAKGGLRNDKG